MKKNKFTTPGQIVTWNYNGHQAIGVIYEAHYISVALNYFMDSNIQKGDLWYCDDIRCTPGSHIRLANQSEVMKLIAALNAHKHPYRYNPKTNTIRDYNVFPTKWMLFKERFLLIWK